VLKPLYEVTSGGKIVEGGINHWQLMEEAERAERLGHFVRAEQLYDRALRLAEWSGRIVDCGVSYLEFATFLQRRGRTQESETLKRIADSIAMRLKCSA
jgi:hypothetical protein